ncbi:TadE/TadG family type IV pilus assembly protein [Chitinimonas sp. BJYL2]|uniref:TadE/TadG family type IV pilus assembly protein n=1 Tax=Chitinimonas sp. BJYL2 TaxID=2976696 RepID=UPI0022B2C26C|nr:TadE/TadG family type IV pilus assembly protein [Chitinimonas sp. BJYL2]
MSPFRQHGQAMAEFLYALPILLLLALGAIQMGFVYQAKLTLNYAAAVGVREGALRNGSMSAIKDGLEAGLSPLYAHSLGTQNMAMLKRARVQAHELLDDPKLAKITILNPTQAGFGAHKADSESGSEIPNDNLMYRDTGAKGGVSVQDANLLKIHVRICYRLFVPIINKLIYNLAVDPPGASMPVATTAPGMLASYGQGSTTRPCTDRPSATEYYLPIESEAIIRMQSPFQDPGVATGSSGVWR